MSLYPSKSQELERNRTLPGAPQVRRTRERILEERRERKARMYDLTCRSEGGAPKWLHCRERMQDATALRQQAQRKDAGGVWASQYHGASGREVKSKQKRSVDIEVFAKKVRRAIQRGWLMVSRDRLPVAGMSPEMARRMMQMGVLCPGAAISRENDDALDRVRADLGMTNDNQSHGALLPGAMEMASPEDWVLYFMVCGWTEQEARGILRLAKGQGNRGVAESAEERRAA